MKFHSVRPKKLASAALAGALLAPFVLSSSIANASEDKAYLFGVVPQQSASRLAKIWIPFLTKLSKDTGLTIKFATTKDIPTFEACLAQGAYEFAYMNPYHYTVFSKSPGYKAFAKQEKKKLRGIIVVRKDSPAKSLADLGGTELAFPSPAAFGASVLPRAELRKSNITHTPKYVKSHDSVYRAVVAGIYPAGGGVLRTFGNVSEGMRQQLRILYRTNKYTPHAFAANSKVTDNKRVQVAEAMVQIGKNEKALLKPLGMKGFETASDADWDDVRGLGLTTDQTEIVRKGDVRCRSD